MTPVEDHFDEIGKLTCILRAIVSSACSHFSFAVMATEAFSQNTGQKGFCLSWQQRNIFHHDPILKQKGINMYAHQYCTEFMHNCSARVICQEDHMTGTL